MTSWEERMAANAAARERAAQAERDRLEREEHDRLVAEGVILEDEEYMDYGPHAGHATHWHHGCVLCSCGVTLGLACIALTDEDVNGPPPPPCAICTARGIPQ